jgi:carboxymethylenebutenolidase
VGEIITFTADGRPIRAQFSTAPSAQGPGMLLLHAWWGLSPFFMRLADRFAREGFTVLAPDYYGGETAEDIEQAKALREKVDRNAVNKTVRNAADFLLGQPKLAGSQIGVVGFSLGCGFAIELARRRPRDVAGVVLFYGIGGGKLDGVNASFLGHFAQQDSWGAHPAKAAALAKRLSLAGVEYHFHTYEGTGHWFFEEDRPEAFQPQAAQLAWTRTVAFLHTKLS